MRSDKIHRALAQGINRFEVTPKLSYRKNTVSTKTKELYITGTQTIKKCNKRKKVVTILQKEKGVSRYMQKTPYVTKYEKVFLSGKNTYLHYILFERVPIADSIISVSRAVVINSIGRASEK
jgi:hypothetical protein